MYENVNSNQEAINQAFVVFFSILGIGAVIAVTFFILKSFAVMKLAKRKGLKHSWLAFVPIAGSYMYGKVAFEDRTMPILLLCINIASFLFGTAAQGASVLLAFFNNEASLPLKDMLSNMSSVNIFQSIYMVLVFYTAYKIYKKLSDKAVTMTVLTVLSCGLLEPIFLFAIRNNELKNEVK